MTDSSKRLALAALLGIAATALVQQAAAAAELSCAHADVRPDYPLVNEPPRVQAIHAADGAMSPSGADCFGTQQSGATWITVAAVVRTSLNQEALIERFGAISQLRTAWYWSTTDQAWRPLVLAAYAIDSAKAVKPRADYSDADLTRGTSLYYSVTDTRSGSPVNYSMQMSSGPAGHLFLETSNIEPVTKWGMTLYGPESVRTLYFLNEVSPGVWSYYSITRAVPASFLANGHEKSYINRAVALYRYYMGLPATSDPPPAR